MLSMSVEHANQLRQLIAGKHRPQPAELANTYSSIIIYYSQRTIIQPKVIFLHMPAGKHKKNFISWDSQCLSQSFNVTHHKELMMSICLFINLHHYLNACWHASDWQAQFALNGSCWLIFWWSMHNAKIERSKRTWSARMIRDKQRE